MVAELAVRIGRVDGAPNSIGQLPIADPGGIEGHLHGFQMAGPTAHDLIIARVGGPVTSESTYGGDDARRRLENGFNGPEAPAGENRHLAPTTVLAGRGLGFPPPHPASGMFIAMSTTSTL